MTTRVVSATRNGRFVAFRRPDGAVEVVDALGPSERRTIARAVAFACVGAELWVADDERAVWRTPLGRDEALVRVPDVRATRVLAVAGRAFLDGPDGGVLVDRGEPVPCDLGGARVLCGVGRRVVVAGDGVAELRTIGRGDALALPVHGDARAAAFVFGERMIAMWVRGASGDAIVACTAGGKLIHRIAVDALDVCAFAEEAGLAIAASGSQIAAIDLRSGVVRATTSLAGVVDLDVDAHGRHLVIARTSGEVVVAPFDAVFAAAGDVAAPAPVEDVVDTGSCATEATTTSAAPIAADALPATLPRALAPRREAPRAPVAVDGDYYRDGNAHLTALLDVVAARAGLAIAESWHSGRTSHDVDGGLPCEHEVLGLLGEDVGLAADELRHARTRLAALAAQLAARTRRSVARGVRLPFLEIARELELSPIATQILALAAAPRLRGRIARLFGVLAGVAGRSGCLDHLLEVLVEPPPGTELGNALAGELAPDAPLVRAGLVFVQGNAITVDDVLLDRLRDVERAVEISAVTVRRVADRTLDEVVAPIAVKRALLLGLAERDERPARIVVRGRRGAGRHTLIAALAARVGRSIGEIDVARLPRGPRLGDALALELVRANLAGAVPVVSGLDAIDRTDGDARRQVEDVLRRHAGPIAVRATPDGDLPLDPERIEVTLPALSLGERVAVWRCALAARGLDALDADALDLLAARFRFGPGTIERVAAQVARRATRGGGPIAALIEEVARQHIAGRLERVATRLTRLAEWDQVMLLDDMRDSVSELIGRMNHQRTVYEDWGFDRRLGTARGLTALFYGPPGTGKTLVAGLIGRELGLDVWRIDLARVMSKWIGETEKSLAEVFEAAEEGQVLLLFDEADSLFGKRSDVKSSNDRYANLEVNYLLQRLDSFEGVAILTTNLEGSIDPAFKRRLSIRLYFPFPDEEQRAQLWAAHVPPGVPRAGELDFTQLARRFPLSGGYIRNSALRAAFLAAQERRPLGQDHLVRAVQLEYRELGKLSSSGRME